MANERKLDYATFKTLVSTLKIYYVIGADGSYKSFCFPTRDTVNYTVISDAADIDDFNQTIRPTASPVPSQDAAAAQNNAETFAGVPAPVQLYTGGKAAPQTSDGRAIVLPNFFPDYVTLYITGAGDDLVRGRGQGTPFTMASDVEGDTKIEFSFIDWVYISGGALKCVGADIGDYITFEVHAPKTPITPSGGNGNCNLVDPGVGAPILIVPAAGDGAFNVDLAQAVPIPALNTDQPRQPVGFWEWTGPDTGKGIVLPGVSGKSAYNLFAIDLDPMARFANKVHLLGDTNDNLTIPAVAPKTFFPQWILRVIVHNGGHPGLKVVFRLITARVKTT